MGHAGNAITRLVVFCDLGSKGNDGTSEVAPDCGAFRREDFVVDVLPEDL